METGDSPVPGFISRYQLRSEERTGTYLAWSPDGHRMAVSTGEASIRILDVESNSTIAILQSSQGWINRVAWSPDGSALAAACGGSGIVVWNLSTMQRLWHLTAHSSWVGQVAWSHSGYRIASGSQDKLAILWDARDGKLLHSFEGHKHYVNCLEWSPDDQTLATGSADQTVRLWDVETGAALQILDYTEIVTSLAWSPNGETLAIAGTDSSIHCWNFEHGRRHVLEGHTADITDLSFSADGLILGSASRDSTVRLWRADTWTTVAVLPLDTPTGTGLRRNKWLRRRSLPQSRVSASPASSNTGYPDSPSLAFHPDAPRLATANTGQYVINTWDLETGILLGSRAGVESLRYTTAKLVLVGDSGVGKTGLGWRLAHGEFKAQASTHGQQFWIIDEIRSRRSDGTECEAVLWDLAGQHVYRSIHAIFLDSVDLALILFDPTNRQEPLKGVEFWLQQLSVKRQLPPTVLVGARIDRGVAVLTGQELDQFCQRYGVSGGYLATSAVTGAGLDQLMSILRTQILWEEMATTVTTVTFKRIKEYVLTLKERPDRRSVLVTPVDLRHELNTVDPDWEFTDAEMMTAVRHLENHGYVTIMRTSSGTVVILLVPELLVELASSIFLQADKHPHELGAISETTLLRGGYPFPELSTLAPAEQHVLLDAAVVRFLSHNLCFRETLGAETLLIFAALIKQKRPLVDEVDTVDDFSYIVHGRVENVYASLVVLLGHTQAFTRVNQWHNQAQYEMGSGQICGFRLIEEREGEIELVLYYSEAMPDFGRRMFQGLFESFLYQHDVAVTPFPPITCANRHKQQRSTIISSLREGLQVIFCTKCGQEIRLPGIEKPLTLGSRDVSLVQREDAIARLRSTYETNLVRVKSFRADRALPRCYISHRPEQASWVSQLTRDLRDAGVLVVDDRAGLQADDSILVIETPAYHQDWNSLAADITSDAGLIRTRLNEASEQGPPAIIPLLREGDAKTTHLAELRDRLAGDFRDDTSYPVRLFELVLTLYAIPLNHPAFTPLLEVLTHQWEETQHVQDAPGTAVSAITPAFESPRREVFLSYAWGGESEAIADELDRALCEKGVAIVRDKRDLGFRGSIKGFMERMGEGKCVILIISEKYLKSENCLFELLQIAQHGDFADRVFPIVLQDAGIYQPLGRIRYIEYWEEQIRELDSEIKKVSAANLDGIREDIDLYTEIRSRLPQLSNILRDMNARTPELHRDSDFSELRQAVVAKLFS